jgi:predicted ATPase/DNA-binding CsgD family transcriptional regulator
VAAVCTLLRRKEIRLVTLTGTAGVGKTRLALEVAERLAYDFADGISQVSLASLSDPAFVMATIAHSIGVTRRGSQPILERLKTSLRVKQRLLLLDNFEHVITEAPLLVELLEACPGLKLLVTSREVLRLRAEHQCSVPPLVLPEDSDPPDDSSLAHVPAVNLFLQRAQAIQSDFHLTKGNAASIAQICIQLDGLPLAIELAAARIKVLAPEALLERLDRRLHILTGGARDLPLRQQTLRNTLSWSYELLPAGEQQLFRRLAVFVGGCELSAIEAVCAAFDNAVDHVLEAVTSLIDKSLLQQTEQERAASRLVMLETIREYGLERLEASGETEAVRRQHASFFLQVALESLPKMNSAEQATWFKRLEADHDNMRAALRFTLESQEVQMGLRLTGVLASGFWISCNYESEGRRWIAQMLEQPGAEARTLARAQALRGLGLLIHVQGDCLEAQRVLEESVSIGREIGAAAKLDLAGALHTLAYVALLQGNPAYARELAEESLRLFLELGVAWGVGLALHHLGRARLELGDPGVAYTLLEESAHQFRVAGDSNLLRLAMNALGLVALFQGDYVAAQTTFEEVLALPIAQGETGYKKFTADALAHLGTVALRRGEYHRSLSYYQQSLVLNQEQGYQEGLIEDLAGLAEMAGLLGQPERTARLLGAVEALREATGIRLSPLRQAEYERTLEVIRAQGDEAAFAAAWQEGHATPLEHLVAQAVEMNEASPTEPKPGEASQEEALSHRPARSSHELTAREVEVLSLLAQGLTSAQIAQQLVIGLVTVNSHVRSIYSKLGVTSRATATRYALEQNLL